MNCLQKGIECGQFRGQVPENEERMSHTVLQYIQCTCTYSVHVHKEQHYKMQHDDNHK